MKFQKIFRRSFTRNSKDDSNATTTKETTTASITTKKSKLFASKSLDDTKSNDSSPKHSNGTRALSKAPLAGKDNSPDIDISKKVTFRETLSQEGIIDNIDHHETLFDDGVLKAFEVGNLSIAQFLESPHTSPDTTPNTTLEKKGKEGDSNTPTHTEILAKLIPLKPRPISSSLPSSPMKKPSLLDQAHAKRSNTARISPPRSKQIDIRRAPVEHNKSATSEMPKIVEPAQQQQQQREIQKHHRFSKSLEHLAQQVFGKEFQKHLDVASKQSTKIPISVADEHIRPMLVRSKTFSPRSPSQNNGEVSAVTCPLSEPPNRRLLRENKPKTSSPSKGLQRRHSASRESDVRKTTTTNFATSTRSIDIPCGNQGIQNELDTLESWDNKLDLSSRNSIGSADVIASSKTRMLPVIEGEVMKSPRKSDSKTDGKNRRRAKSVGCDSNSSMDVGRLQKLHTKSITKKLTKTDSEVAHYGSAGEKDLSASESSVLDIQFPPPPPVEEEISVEQIEIPEETISFDWEILSDEEEEGGGWQGENCSALELNLKTDCGNDALIESLMSIVPLPENQQELRPALTKALGEIVSEIVSSRRKLTRLFKAIEIHQQILKEQNRKIESQTKEIAHLRLITFGLENGLSATVKLRADHQKSRRPQSARTYRQSREMIELNYTLDKLLYQCSSLRQANVKPVLNTLTHNGEKSSRTLVRRSKSFPSRNRFPSKKSDSKSESEC